MGVRIALGAILSLVAAAVFAQETTRSIWDGVYTEAQAKRGKPPYDLKCADCHGEDLEGDAEAPALSGSEFLWKWNGLTLDQLFERIHRDMPLNNARTLSREETADILAYILQVNTMPPGKIELSHDQPALKGIRIVPVR